MANRSAYKYNKVLLNVMILGLGMVRNLYDLHLTFFHIHTVQTL